LTLTLPEETPVAEIFSAVNTFPSHLLEEFLLLDIYRGPSVGAGKKNVTFRFRYRDPQKTLSQEAVEKEHKRWFLVCTHWRKSLADCAFIR